MQLSVVGYGQREKEINRFVVVVVVVFGQNRDFSVWNFNSLFDHTRHMKVFLRSVCFCLFNSFFFSTEEKEEFDFSNYELFIFSLFFVFLLVDFCGF